MTKVFDTAVGRLHLGGGICLDKDLSPQQVEQLGIQFSSTQDMKTGWVYRNGGPYKLLSRSTYISLAFENDYLKSICLSFADVDGDIEDLHAEHDSLLVKQLGKPTLRDDWRIIYSFKWGEICSYNDPRGGACNIGLRWN